MRVHARRPAIRRATTSLVSAATLAALTLAAAPADGDVRTATLRDALADAESGANDVLPLTDQPRRAQPEDRYAMASGCYVVRAPNGAFLERADGTFTATARGPRRGEPLRFQAYDLGKYLLYATAEDFLAAESSPTREATETVLDEAEGAVRGAPRPPAGDEDTAEEPRDDDALEPVTGPALTVTDGARDATVAAREAMRGSAIVAATEPSASAEWVVREAGRGGAFTFHLPEDDGAEDDPGPIDPPISGTLTASGDGTLAVVPGVVTDASARFRLVRAEGCAVWPEPAIGIAGPHATGDTPYEEVRGYFDAHLHMMAFEFLGGRARCGRPWHPYGPRYALVDCPDHEPGGHGAILEAALTGGNPIEGHATDGWPTFSYWPDHASYTHEQVYYRWLERSWRGGLRMFTNLLVDNGALCEIYPYKENSCNEMDGVRLQAQRLRELERYIDAQYGGPGEGWFRIVDDPFEARRVINAGKLAVVMGIEVSVLFDCGEYLGRYRCDEAQIDRQLAEVYDIGVRQMELVNKFDNALSGVAGDSGSTGLVVNQGNRYETGHYWPMTTCDDGHAHDHDLHAHDKTQPNPHDEAPEQMPGRDALAGGVIEVFGSSGVAPVYPAGPHCNTIGLTPLGDHLIRQMVQRGMLFDPDHMSAKGRQEALDLLDAIDYPGVVSSHSWADDLSYKRIWDLGGVVAPMTKDSTGFIEKWKRQKAWAAGRYFGLGYGADTNGFASQGPPRHPGEDEDVDYPFTGFGGVQVDRQRNVDGQVEGRTFDINTDGVAHYGLYPDWIEDIRVLAGGQGDEILADMQKGPEAYLRVWERAIGIAGDACTTGQPLEPAAVEDTVGSTAEQVLVALGQPAQRTDTVMVFCTVAGTATVHFDGDGRVAEVATTEAPLPRDVAPASVERGAAPAELHDHATHDHGPLDEVTRVAGASSVAGLPAGLLAGLATLVVAATAVRRSRRRVD